jgi:hypothetical protein
MAIEVPLLSATCSLGPVNVTSSTANPGGSPLQGNPPTGTLTATSFVVPAVVVSATCDQAAADAVNKTLVLPSNENSISLTVVRVFPSRTTTTTAPAARAVQPTFTG